VSEKYKNAKEQVEGIEINEKVLYHFAKFARIAEILITLIERIDARREERWAARTIARPTAMKYWLPPASAQGGKDSAPLDVLASPLPRLAPPRLYSRRDGRSLNIIMSHYEKLIQTKTIINLNRCNQLLSIANHRITVLNHKEMTCYRFLICEYATVGIW